MLYFEGNVTDYCDDVKKEFLECPSAIRHKRMGKDEKLARDANLPFTVRVSILFAQNSILKLEL